MIIGFSFENWMSFRDEVSFSMIATKERQHGERVPKIAKYQKRVLPVAAVFGGNASGKSNFFKALSFVRELVLEGSNPNQAIPVQPYRLDNHSTNKPSSFRLELLIAETIYEFSFILSRQQILKEKLVKINSSSETTLYERDKGQVKFAATLKDQDFLHFVFKATRDNQLFLTSSVYQNVRVFRPVYDWFSNVLQLVDPNSTFGSFEHFFDSQHPLYNAMGKMLLVLDTGISHLDGVEISLGHVPLPDEIKEQLKQTIDGDKSCFIHAPLTNERFIITQKNGELIAKKLVTSHLKKDGTKVKFDINEESDGSQRLIELLPAFIQMSERHSARVYVIDELSRSLHPLLTQQLITTYLQHCTPDNRSQLLITTHDLLLMDQQLLRRDEIWITERSQNGNSQLTSFSDYEDIRYDKDIRKSYLQGRMGGVPEFPFHRASLHNFFEKSKSA